MRNLEGAFDEGGGALQKEENQSSEIRNHSERLLQHQEPFPFRYSHYKPKNDGLRALCP